MQLLAYLRHIVYLNPLSFIISVKVLLHADNALKAMPTIDIEIVRVKPNVLQIIVRLLDGKPYCSAMSLFDAISFDCSQVVMCWLLAPAFCARFQQQRI